VSSLRSGRVGPPLGDTTANHHAYADSAGDSVVIVLLPEYLPRNRIEQFLYNDNARRIREAILGLPNVLVAEVPYRRAA